MKPLLLICPFILDITEQNSSHTNLTVLPQKRWRATARSYPYATFVCPWRLSQSILLSQHITARIWELIYKYKWTTSRNSPLWSQLGGRQVHSATRCMELGSFMLTSLWSPSHPFLPCHLPTLKYRQPVCLGVGFQSSHFLRHSVAFVTHQLFLRTHS